MRKTFTQNNKKASKGSAEPIWLAFQTLSVRGDINSHWAYDSQIRLIDHYNVNFDLQNAKLNLTPIVLHSMLQIRENYFGWSYYPVTSEEIRYWGGRNLRSRYAGRDWIVDKQTKKRVRAHSNISDTSNNGTNNNGNNVNTNNTMQNI